MFILLYLHIPILVMERRQIHDWNHTAGCGAMSIHNVTFFYRQYKKLDETDQGIWDGRRERPAHTVPTKGYSGSGISGLTGIDKCHKL
jgi:hypothetical protein